MPTFTATQHAHSRGLRSSTRSACLKPSKAKRPSTRCRMRTISTFRRVRRLVSIRTSPKKSSKTARNTSGSGWTVTRCTRISTSWRITSPRSRQRRTQGTTRRHPSCSGALRASTRSSMPSTNSARSTRARIGARNRSAIKTRLSATKRRRLA